MAGKGVEFTADDREAIRLHRVAANKTRKAVAAAVGRSARWLHRIERGGSAVLTLKDLFKLAEELGVPRDFLVRK